MMNGVVPDSAAVYDYMTDLGLTLDLVNKTTGNVLFNYSSRDDSLRILSTIITKQQKQQLVPQVDFSCLSQALAVSDHFPVEVKLMGQKN